MADAAGLRALARLHGVQTDYSDDGELRRARPAALRAVLASRGVDAANESEVESSLRLCRRAVFTRMLPRVAVVWHDAAQAETPAEARSRASVPLRLSSTRSFDQLECSLELESGELRRWTVRPNDLRTVGRRRLEDDVVVRKNLPIEQSSAAVSGSAALTEAVPKAPLPLGYHRLTIGPPGSGRSVESGTVAKAAFATSQVIVAPSSCFVPDDARRWGVFMPLHALRTSRSMGIGDLTDLDRFIQWASTCGASAVGTLPLLASFLGREHVPGPYSPASRLFWNEVYLDPHAAPGLGDCPEARAMLDRPDVRETLEALGSERLVDYSDVAEVKRRILEVVATRTIGGNRAPPVAFARFLEKRPDAAEYARFRAAGENHGEEWREWPIHMRDGVLGEGDFDVDAERYHLYVQWAFHEQATQLARSSADRGVSLYLDLPLGAHPDSYDAWREQHLHAGGISVGAPPDAFFAGGQDWGFAPPDPIRMREAGYRHFRACIRNHLRYAHILRLDHVMSLHRLYWIPAGHSARDGVYVRYPTEDLFAILCLESRRAGAEMVGEDLGTVAPAIRRRMRRHGVRRMYVAQFQIDPASERPLRPVPEGAVASINTHDMPTFAAFWHGLDIDERVELGLLDAASAARERTRRKKLTDALLRVYASEPRVGSGEHRTPIDPGRVRDALLRRLASSPASMVLVSLEDLWLETESQNMPGTSRERANWRRRARLALEEFADLTVVRRALSAVDHGRQSESSTSGGAGNRSGDEEEKRKSEDDLEEAVDRE